VSTGTLTIAQAETAGAAWGHFNCGPGALCAVLGMSPEELRPIMGDYERKGYTNPTLMFDILKRSGARWQSVYRSDDPTGGVPSLALGLLRIQWGGPWTRDGVPMRARYRHTHWVGLRAESREVFDINALAVGGWIGFGEWSTKLLPWLARECVPKWDGRWWPTHAIAVQPEARR